MGLRIADRGSRIEEAESRTCVSGSADPQSASVNPRSAIRNPQSKRLQSAIFAVLFALACSAASFAQAKRVVVLKIDGLSQDQIDRFVHERDERTGKSRLPWIEHVFYQRGTIIQNFYVRGMSLSAPSWSMLDTGQHLQVKGNVEFDRLTLHSYDYLNFVPFWLGNAFADRVDMPGTTLLDELGVPLLYDNYRRDERHLSFQIYQRGARWSTVDRAWRNYLSRAPRDLFDEWVAGVQGRDLVMSQLEREMIQRLSDPRVRYLDYYTTEFDHATHHNHDLATRLAALQDVDATVGRVWTAIRQTPEASETALVLVSDHGTNTDERVYSQGFNVVHLLSSREGGGHHVVTKRRLMNDYAVKGLDPLVPLIYTTSDESYYLRGQSNDYPTALVDFDGNERSSIHLRDSDLNVLHILLQQLQSKSLDAVRTRAATDALFATIDRRRAEWQSLDDELTEEIGALDGLIDKQQAAYDAARAEMKAQKKQKETDPDPDRDLQVRRLQQQLDNWRGDARNYREYLRTLSNLLALRRETFDPSKIKIADLIARGAMGSQNALRELQDYVVGPSPSSLVVGADGRLDFARSFVRVNYLSLLRETRVRNNVQPGLDSHPVDFVALRVEPSSLPSVDGDGLRADTAVWLYRSPADQALVLSRDDAQGARWLRYLPVSNLTQDADGKVHFDRAAWRDDLPLKIWEDEKLRLPAGARREEWLSAWHTDNDWLHALHMTQYSNGLVGLSEQFTRSVTPLTDFDAPGLTRDERLIRRLRWRRRRLVETDMLVLANNHWNFDVRGFNPGGNHGSFFRVSTHSALMFAGGDATGIPRARVVEEPYDSLSFVPTFLTLTGQLPRPGASAPASYSHQERRYPGRVITEVFGTPERQGAPATDTSSGAKTSNGSKN